MNIKLAKITPPTIATPAIINGAELEFAFLFSWLERAIFSLFVCSCCASLFAKIVLIVCSTSVAD